MCLFNQLPSASRLDTYYHVFVLSLGRFDVHQSAENTLYLDCFCVVAAGIGVSRILAGTIIQYIISNVIPGPTKLFQYYILILLPIKH